MSACDWMDDEEAQRAYREKNFAVIVEPINHPYLYRDELLVRVTHNGYQWTAISLTPTEAERVISALEKHLSDLRSKKK